MEALLRWSDPQRGNVSPADFIPVAEESGLIVPLGEWVLHTACRDTVALQQKTGQPLRVAVNLSSHQFRNGDIVASIAQALRESGLPASQLEVEITEGVLMDRTDSAIERMRAIRALGVDIAIDDFGTGFSSLSYVTRFPINTLKIDRSFVSKMTQSTEDAAVAQAIIALAHSLDVRVVAEGVETAEQIEFLRDRCCDKAQGYLIGRPVAPERFSAQGYHFSRARAAGEFADCLAQLRRECSARSAVH
jgi:EAL domain-containing protein (putative c-di-GMP-specific phosphodiesterase class I)